MWPLHFNIAIVAKLLVYFLLIFDQQHIILGGKLLSGVNVIKSLGSIKDVVKHATTIGDACEYLENNALHIDSEYQRDKVEEKLQNINLKFDTVRSDISFLQTRLYEKLEEMDKIRDLNDKMNELERKILKIDFLYEQLLAEVNPLAVHEINVTRSLVDNIVNSANGITWRLTEIHNLLLTSEDNNDVLKSLGDPNLGAQLICQNGQSSQQMIHNVYKRIALAEIKGFVMLDWAYGKLKETSKRKTTHVKEATNNLVRRLSTTLSKVKKQMIQTSNDFYECDPNEVDGQYWIYGKHYETFGPFLQKYVMYSSEANNAAYECDECETYKAVKPSCFTNLCDQTKFSDYACRGIARNCKSMHKQLSICKSNERHRKYEYIETGEKEKFGRKLTCPNKPFEGKSKILLNLHRCDYCLCTCENTYNDFARYFDTREITSDIENNKVITGAQLLTNKDVFYIKIWQGQLIPNGYANGTEEKNNIDLRLPHHQDLLGDAFSQFLGTEITVDERPVAREGHEYYALNWENRTFGLDDLYAPPNHVLTGLKLVPAKDHIKLAIRVTPFEFATGKLQKDKSNWISNKAGLESRTELNLANLDVPILSHDDVLDSRSNQYVTLDTSGFEQDAGQNVVPFIDIQPVVSDPAGPFAGAGLMHKGGKRHAGFLALKLKTYDFTPHLTLDLDVDKLE